MSCARCGISAVRCVPAISGSGTVGAIPIRRPISLRPASAEALAERITERLPRVSLPELLIEVDTWTHFSRHFVHAADAAGLRPAFLPHFYASLLAHACNFGVEQMAHVTDLAYDHFAW